MHAVILAAGEGSRMGGRTRDVPKAFMTLDGRTLFDRQRDALAGNVDDITVVIGYQYENVIDELGPARPLVFPDWAEYENAESLRRALETIDDDVLVLNGDVVVSTDTIDRLIERHASFRDERSAVACYPDVQDERTAIRRTADGIVTQYGMIRGHRHAGLGIIDRVHVDAAERHLRGRGDQWYPIVYPEIPTRAVEIAPADHVEINCPQDAEAARRRFPLDGADGGGCESSVAARSSSE